MPGQRTVSPTSAASAGGSAVTAGHGPGGRESRAARDRRRRGQLLNHLIVFFAVMVVITPVNAWLDPERLWFVLPLVVWGAPLAVHTAWAMGLFDRRR